MSEEKEVNDGARLDAFLKDEVVQRALAALNRQYFDEFKASSSPQERESAWAKARVLEDFGTTLQSVIDTGKLAKARRDQRQAVEERQRSRR
jgi:hypothetical protein